MTDREKINQPRDRSSSQVTITRRQFNKALGAGILMTVGVTDTSAGQTAKTKARSTVSDRLHVGVNGQITVMTGKVEVGQGSRTELTLVAAEELKVDVGSIRLVMGDTGAVPR